MKSIAITPQNMRECRWCQPQFRVTPDTDESMADAPWECVRITGQERPVSDEECAGCDNWEPDYGF
jgi:hypothetical protein